MASSLVCYSPPRFSFSSILNAICEGRIRLLLFLPWPVAFLMVWEVGGDRSD
jgi:hypothetical protein